MSVQQFVLQSALVHAFALLVTVAFIVTIARQTAQLLWRVRSGTSPRGVEVTATLVALCAGPFVLVAYDAVATATMRVALAVFGHDRLVPWPGVHGEFVVAVVAPAVLLTLVLVAVGAVRETVTQPREDAEPQG